MAQVRGRNLSPKHKMCVCQPTTLYPRRLPPSVAQGLSTVESPLATGALSIASSLDTWWSFCSSRPRKINARHTLNPLVHSFSLIVQYIAPLHTRGILYHRKLNAVQINLPPVKAIWTIDKIMTELTQFSNSIRHPAWSHRTSPTRNLMWASHHEARAHPHLDQIEFRLPRSQLIAVTNWQVNVWFRTLSWSCQGWHFKDGQDFCR